MASTAPDRVTLIFGADAVNYVKADESTEPPARRSEEERLAKRLRANHNHTPSGFDHNYCMVNGMLKSKAILICFFMFGI
jgi:hypothetical protein